jgi:hypothetical protein
LNWKQELRWLGGLLFDSTFFFLLVALTVNSLYATWSLNPLYDLLYSRVQGMIFYNSHSSSICFLCLTAFVMIAKDRGHIARWTLALFGVAAIHEFALNIFDLTVFGVSSGMAVSYAIWLGFFLLIGWFVIPVELKQRWIAIAVFMFLFYLLTFSFHVGSSNNGFLLTSLAFNFWTDLTEVSSWIIPTSFFYLPKEWFKWTGIS